jgi:hypothetical protein
MPSRLAASSLAWRLRMTSQSGSPDVLVLGAGFAGLELAAEKQVWADELRQRWFAGSG